jgi:hypothetical protein
MEKQREPRASLQPRSPDRIKGLQGALFGLGPSTRADAHAMRLGVAARPLFGMVKPACP